MQITERGGLVEINSGLLFRCFREDFSGYLVVEIAKWLRNGQEVSGGGLEP